MSARSQALAIKPKRGGPPTRYSAAVVDEICSRISAGESLTNICKLKHMPSRPTVIEWLSTTYQSAQGDPSRFSEFQSRYASARQLQADVMDERIMDVVDKVLVSKVDPQAARVAIGAMQWRASKLKPKVYGDKIEVEAQVQIGLGVLIAAARQRIAAQVVED